MSKIVDSYINNISLLDITKWKGKLIHQLGSIWTAMSASDVGKLTKDFFENMNGDMLDGGNLSEELKKALAQRFSKVTG